MPNPETPLIGPDDEVREISKADLSTATRGRPPLPKEQRKQRINLMLDRDVVAALRDKPNMSALVNQALREKMGL